MRTSVARAGPILVAVAFVALAFRLYRLAGQYAVNVLFWDQWDINDAFLFGHHSAWEIFAFQHGPHRQGLGGLLSALIEPWFRWNSRTEAFVVTSILVVGGLCILLLKVRLFGALSWTDVVIPMLIFTPAQWESDWVTVNLAHGVLPVVLIVLYCLSWTWRDDRGKYPLVTALNFVTLYTGFGFFLGLITPALLAAKYREARRSRSNSRLILICLLLSIASLASFFIAYKNQDASGCTSLWPATPLVFVQFLCLMFVSPFGIRDIGLAAILTGAAVLVAVASVAFVSWRKILAKSTVPGVPHMVMAILSGYAILFSAAATIGRTCTGLTEAHASRYAIYKQLGMLSLYFWVLAAPKIRRRKILAGVLPLLFIPSLFLTSYDRQLITDYYHLKSGWRECYLSGKPADDCDDENGAIYPDPDETHLQEKLDYLRVTRQNLFCDAPEVRR